ncbi:hypothetical protein ACS0TY_004131 [Phlomoides rotata]
MSSTTVEGNVACYCGKKALIRTSWTDQNPGRRFLCCVNSRRREGCVFWKWEDPEMCMRSKMIIPGLLRRVNAAEAEIEKLRASVKKQNYRLVILISILCMMLAWKMAGQL